jgi:hypothetical protein
VGHPDRVDAERADLDGLAGHEGAQVGVHAALLQPLAREAEGEAAAVDRGGRGLQGPGQRADVVLVAVGEEHGEDAVPARREVLEVGDDRVHPRHPGRREEHAGVEQEYVPLPLEDEGVETELAEPAERDEPDRPCVVTVASVQPSPPTDPSRATSQIAANSTTDSVSARLDPSKWRDLKYSLR